MKHALHANWIRIDKSNRQVANILWWSIEALKTAGAFYGHSIKLRVTHFESLSRNVLPNTIKVCANVQLQKQQWWLSNFPKETWYLMTIWWRCSAISCFVFSSRNQQLWRKGIETSRRIRRHSLPTAPIYWLARAVTIFISWYVLAMHRCHRNHKKEVASMGREIRTNLSRLSPSV